MLQLQSANGTMPPVALSKSPLRLGRAPANDVVLNHPSVVEMHAELQTGADGWLLVDRSGGATFVNAEPVTGQRLLRPGDILRLGTVELKLVAAQQAAGTVMRSVAAEWSLVAKDTGKTFAVTRDAIVGRQPDCAIPIVDDCISRNHARVSLKDGSVTVEDLGSTNGTFVNGERIKQPRVLKEGDEVGFDHYTFRVVGKTAAAAASAAGKPTVAAPAAPPPAPKANTEPPAAKPPVAPPRTPAEPASKPAAGGPAPAAAPLPALTPRNTKWYERHSMGPRRTTIMPAGESQSGATQAPMMPPAEIAGITLVGLSKSVEGRRIELLPGTQMVGRAKDNNIPIDDPQISDRHAQLVVDKGSVSVVSMPNCTNGTFVNRARAAGRVYLNSGDIVSFGQIEFQLWLPGVAPRRSPAPDVAAGPGPNWLYVVLGFIAVLAVALTLIALLA